VTEPVGLAGVVAALSVTSDLTRGHPPGEAMRACLLATELARRSGLDHARRSDVYYATLLRFAGCAATSHEMAARFRGNDVLVRARGDLADTARPTEALQLLAGLGAGLGKVTMVAKAVGAQQFYTEGVRADCEVGADLTRRLRLPDRVTVAVLDGFERYDGRGAPARRAGTDVAEAARFAAVGFTAVMFDAVGGGGAAGATLAAETMTRWSGRALDPEIAAAFVDAPAELLTLAAPEDLWAATVEAEPLPRRTFRDDPALDEALAGFGDAADLKSPWFHGHSRGVGQLARAAAARLGSVDERLVHRAGLVHDLGRVAVPTGIWERPGPLRPEEWELVRLHPYHSGRILSRSPVLAGLGAVVSRHHERTDGSGYPAGVRLSELDPAAALLAAGDALHALGEARPPRPALDLAAAGRALAAMPLERDAIRAVVDAAGAPRPALPRLPADLTERELEVLRRLASGRTKRQIAAELVISASTVHTHTVHIYAKCEVSTRAGLAMFAMQHGLAGGVGPAASKID
jgi:HD-GYP domain-containing protein (c-di-GMP phosphodiesterase class II)/DNA-binding CsgD family transcriptional regulator